MAPPRRIPAEQLKPRLAEMRAQGMTTKQIARELGCYTAQYIAVLCGQWGLRISRTAMHWNSAVAQGRPFDYKKRQEGAPNGNVSAANLAVSEAKPDDSPNGDS